MNDELDMVMQVFGEEAHELLDKLAQGMAELRAVRGEERVALLDAMKRTAHNLKGSAATVGVHGIARIAHAFEDVLRRVEAEEIEVSEAIFDIVLEAVSVMQAVVDRQAGDEETDEVLARMIQIAGLQAQPVASQGEVAARARRPEEAKGRAKKSKGTVRVDVTRLDSLMALVGEMWIALARMRARHKESQDALTELRLLFRDAGLAERAAPYVKRQRAMQNADRRELLDFSQLSTTFADAMKSVRMMPLSALGPVWRRIVRESAAELGKKAELTVDVGNVEVDKDVLDELRDPLMHLLRNAVGHGIEAPEERERLGKPASGSVHLRAVVQGGTVGLEVSDDGRGLDARAIVASAIAKGIVTREESALLTERQELELVFQPGFSTALEVSNVSGRGVGLDVVKSNVEKLGGNVTLAARSALMGAAFTVNVPITTLSSRVLFVRCNDALYALPIDAVSRTSVVASSEVSVVDGASVLALPDEDPVPLVVLRQLLGRKSGKAQGKLHIVTISRREGEVALVVDEVVSEQEVVVRSLPWNVPVLPLTNGVVVLADGSLALALDVRQVFDMVGRRGSSSFGKGQATAVASQSRLLVVDDSISSRLLLKNILGAAGYDVALAVNGEEALKMLRSQRVDLVLSDVHMPVLDGFGLVEKIRADSQLQDTPVLLVSSDDAPEQIARGAAVGADEYVVKGKYEQHELLETVARYLGSRDDHHPDR